MVKPDEVRAAWETNARFWDERYQEGNDFHLKLIAPATEALLGIGPGETVLDIACGNGTVSRRLAALGANVVAFDVSAPFIECALERTKENAERIDYRVLDATDADALRSLGEHRFDAAVCTMALMDMSDIDPLAEALPALLKPGGRFVFSIMHPCFNQMGTRLALEEEDREGEIVRTPSIRVVRYMTPFDAKGLGMVGQPVPHPYFHRPLQELLRPFLAQGFVLDGLEERAFPPNPDRPPRLSWSSFPEVPPVLLVRLEGRPA